LSGELAIDYSTFVDLPRQTHGLQLMRDELVTLKATLKAVLPLLKQYPPVQMVAVPIIVVSAGWAVRFLNVIVTHAAASHLTQSMLVKVCLVLHMFTLLLRHSTELHGCQQWHKNRNIITHTEPQTARQICLTVASDSRSI